MKLVCPVVNKKMKYDSIKVSFRNYSVNLMKLLAFIPKNTKKKVHRIAA